MRKTIIALTTGAACFNLAAQIRIFDSGMWPDIRVAAQKSNGQITAAGVGSSLHAWNWNERWQPTYHNSPWNGWSSSSFAKGIPVRMDNVVNGAVVSLWDQTNNGSVFCLVHDSEGYGASARFTNLHGPAGRARIFMDSQTNFWITEAGLNIYRAPGRGRVYHQSPTLIHTIVVDELWPDGNARDRLPVSMIEDGRGRIWFWSNCLLGSDSRGAVHGVLVYQNGALTNYPTLDGVTTGRISVIAPLDRTNLWLAVRDAGIFAINLKTLRGSLIPAPEAGAFHVVERVFQDGGDIYVIAGVPGGFTKDGLQNSLWRRRDGVWKKLIPGLDSTGTLEQFAGRHCCFTADGLWLGAFGTGGWCVPRDNGESRQIAWQVGSPFDTIDRWFQLKNGQMLALDFGRGGMLADPALLTAQPVKTTAKILQLERPLIQTADGKIFAIRRGEESALSEWDGRRWRQHPFPDHLRLWSDCAIATDARARIWFIDRSYNPDPALRSTMIYDPARGKFQRYSSFPTALQTQTATLAGTQLNDNESSAAVFSDDGRICYLDHGWQACYFDGHQWHQWRLNDIVHGGVWGTGEHKPYFGAGGRLSVAVNNSVWQFDDLSGWKKTSLPAPDNSAGNAPAAGTPDVPEASSIATDRRGIYWVVAHKQLYRVGYGFRAAVFPPDERQPFADGRKLTGVLMDNFGNAFLQTSLQGHKETVLVPAREPLPEIKLKMRESNADGVVLEMSAPGVARPRFVWRTDGGAWGTATTNNLLRLEDLDAGKHEVEVLSLDDRLQPAPSPALWKFDVRSIPAERVQRFVAQLHDRDFARREAAVTWLTHHPTLALPALRAALEHETSPDRRWWIQAAIQQCQ